jgi:Uncharacterized protein conserved in archaea
MDLQNYAEENSLKILGISGALLVAAVAVTGSGFLMDEKAPGNDMDGDERPMNQGMEEADDMEDIEKMEETDDMEEAGERSEPGDMHGSDRYDVSDLPKEELSDQEVEDIRFMRQEEALAYDVYGTFYDEYGVKAFTNIESSEETHTGAIEGLVLKYDLDDPYNESTDSFDSQEFSDLREKLVDRGMESEVEALKAAAEVEDRNIAHLREKLENTDNQDTQEVYSTLLGDAKRHLTAFDRQLDRRDASYEPSFISKSDYEEITADTNRGQRR